MNSWENFLDYLNDLGTLYVQGVRSSNEFSQSSLRRLGGALALASIDREIVIERESAWQRIFNESGMYNRRLSFARTRWQVHRENILRKINQGTPPAYALRDYFRQHGGSHPHSQKATHDMIQTTSSPLGTMPSWQYNLIELRNRVHRALNTLSDNTFTALATTLHIVATANDWEKATPHEWETAVVFGEAFAPVSDAVDALSGVVEARNAHADLNRGYEAHEADVGAEIQQSGPPHRSRRQVSLTSNRRTDGRAIEGQRGIEPQNVQRGITSYETHIEASPTSEGRARHGVEDSIPNRSRRRSRSSANRALGATGAVEQEAGYVLQRVVNSRLPYGSENNREFPNPYDSRKVRPDHLPPGIHEIFLDRRGGRAKSGIRFSARFVGDSKYQNSIRLDHQTKGFVHLAKLSETRTLVFYIRWQNSFPSAETLSWDSSFGGRVIPTSFSQRIIPRGLRQLAERNGVTIRLVSDPMWL